MEVLYDGDIDAFVCMWVRVFVTNCVVLTLRNLWSLCKKSLYVITRNGNVKSWITWWRHQMETFSALLAICAGNSPVTGEFPAQRKVARSFDVFFDLRPSKWSSKQSRGLWVETPSSPLWRYSNVFPIHTFGEVALVALAISLMLENRSMA